ncbi:glycoside hydrolase family 18 protein [Enterovibrio norvegicus]|uniref:glycoside hydrolase family 18 protein n=1 Tax=Enterovibrio norvegicus TaxID=188144 RepID=UPI000C83F984|nr:glycoside hydrolase family 18 protein [Enterovibrio norvegicus]PMN70619.1 hypothetical protein BCT27_02585 [Enterovibrio norvegicus]
MNKSLVTLLILPFLLSGCGGSSEKKATFSAAKYNQDSGKIVGTYFTSWSSYNGYTPIDIPGGDLTHIFYAFLATCGGEKPKEQMNSSDKKLEQVCNGKKLGELVFTDRSAALGYYQSNGTRYKGDIEEFSLLKKEFPHLKIMPSVGGWDLSGPFHDLIQTDEGMNHFVSSTVEFLKRNPVFDGIDIDWEFPGGDGATTPDSDPELALTPKEKAFEKKQFTVLMSRFRAAFDVLSQETGRHYELTAAVNGFEKFAQHIDYENVSQYMDYYLVMTYDFFVVGRKDIGHFANLYAVEPFPESGADIMVEYLLGQGVPSNKLVIGSNNAGRGWEGVPEFGSTGEATFGPNQATGAMDDAFPTYKDILRKYKNNPDFIDKYDEVAEAAYLYSPNREQYISYDDPRSVTAKTKYVVEQNLGGVFSWDIKSDNYDLLNATNAAIGNSVISRD